LRGKMLTITASLQSHKPARHCAGHARIRRYTNDAHPQQPAKISDVDVVCSSMHGGAGEEAAGFPACSILRGLSIPASNHIRPSATAMDTGHSRASFLAGGVQTADWLMAPVLAHDVSETLGGPWWSSRTHKVDRRSVTSSGRARRSPEHRVGTGFDSESWWGAIPFRPGAHVG